MKVTNDYIMDCKGSLEALLNMPPGNLTVQARYWLGRLGRVLSDPMEQFQHEKNSLIKLHGHREGPGYTIGATDDMDKYTAELDALKAIEVDLAWTPIKITARKDLHWMVGGHQMFLDRFFDIPEPGAEDDIEIEAPQGAKPENGKAENVPELKRVK